MSVYAIAGETTTLIKIGVSDNSDAEIEDEGGHAVEFLDRQATR